MMVTGLLIPPLGASCLCLVRLAACDDLPKTGRLMPPIHSISIGSIVAAVWLVADREDRYSRRNKRRRQHSSSRDNCPSGIADGAWSDNDGERRCSVRPETYSGRARFAPCGFCHSLAPPLAPAPPADGCWPALACCCWKKAGLKCGWNPVNA